MVRCIIRFGTLSEAQTGNQTWGPVEAFLTFRVYGRDRWMRATRSENRIQQRWIYPLAMIALLAASVALLWRQLLLDQTVLFGARLTISPELRLVVLLMLCGAIGSYFQLVLSTYQSKLFETDVPPLSRFLIDFTYRPLLGGILAVGVYFASRATGTTSLPNLNLTFLVAEAIVVGMFSGNVLRTMHELFRTLLSTEAPTDQVGRKGRVEYSRFV